MTTLRTSRLIQSKPSGSDRQLAARGTLEVSERDGTLGIAFAATETTRGAGEIVVSLGRADLTLLVQEAISIWPDLAPALTAQMVGTLTTALASQRKFQTGVVRQVLGKLERVDHALDDLAAGNLPASATRLVVKAGDALETARGTLEAL